MTVSGLALPVDAERLQALDTRELNYDRVDVTGLVEGVPGRVWTYLGRAPGRARLARGLAEGTAVVSRDYLEKVHGRLPRARQGRGARVRAHHRDPRDPADGPGAARGRGGRAAGER